MRLEGKVAIVSGGGTGIGAATARRFAAEGAKVVVTGRRPEPLEEVAADTVGLAVPGDAADPTHAPAVVAATLERFGGVDVVVANAGVGFGGSAGEVDDERWARTIDVNLTGPLRLVRRDPRTDRARRRVDRAGVEHLGTGGVTDSAAYMASKIGLVGLARSLAVDYGPNAIRANALCPGWVVTPMADEGADELAEARGITREEAYLLGTEQVPLRRPATADEMASCVLFLASDESSYVTGAVIVADGGTTIVDAGSLAWD